MPDKSLDSTARVNRNNNGTEAMASTFSSNSRSNSSNNIREAVCINANRIYDSCGDKDCLEDLRVSFTDAVQPIIDEAYLVKPKTVEVMDVIMSVEAVPFHKGFYSVDMTYYFLVTLSVYSSPLSNATEVTGVCTFCKKVVLFGSEGSVKTFTNDQNVDSDPVGPKTLPKVTVQVAEPMLLSSCAKDCADLVNEWCSCSLPSSICSCFEGSFENVLPQRNIFISIGIFSIVQMERQVQMMIPIYDYCIPEKECTNTSENPCDVFKKIKFPLEEFFPSRDVESASECSCK